ncbi:hypothetical protein ACOME3_004831 [Neoechinorhynchus agilis]
MAEDKGTRTMNGKFRISRPLPEVRCSLTDTELVSIFKIKYLIPFADRISDLGVFGGHRSNCCLINEYSKGQGIMPHHDGPCYFPCVSTISLGAPTLIHYYEPILDDVSISDKDRYFRSVCLNPRSLFVVQEEMYTHYMHGINELHSETISENVLNRKESQLEVGDVVDRSKTRVSLTFRYALGKEMKIYR